jgi:hypothetical protein
MSRPKVRNTRKGRAGLTPRDSKSRHHGNCRGLLPHITDFLEGEAGKDVCQRISQHLVRCKKCRMYVDAHAGVIQLFKAWRDDPMPAVAKVRLRHTIDGLIAGSSGR